MNPLASIAQPVQRGLLDRVLSVRELSTLGEGVELGFARPWPAWTWVLIVLGCMAIAGWSYWRLAGSPRARLWLAGLRALALVLLAVLISGPRLVRQNERVERDWVVMLLDRSRSMLVPDAPAQAGRAATRDEQLQLALRDAAPAIESLRSKRELLVLGFDAEAYEAPASGPALGAWLSVPEGSRTAIGAALSQAMRRVDARPVAGVVLFSDGRSFDQPTQALLQDLRERRIAVYPYALGSAKARPDLAITRVEAPSAAFAGDLVPVSADIELRGEGAPGGRVQLVDADGTVLDETDVPPELPSDSSTRVTLSTRASTEGQRQWSVRLVLDEPDLSSANNSQALRLSIVDEPVRVVNFDGYPRWEYRYLKNLLLRERSVISSNLLLAPNRRSIQEGQERLDSLPRTASEWAPFDVVIMGDVRPSLFTQEQLESLRTLVSERGAGLLFIAGESSMPHAWAGTPLGELLPFSLSSADPRSPGSSVGTHTDPVLVSPGPAARQYGVLQLGATTRDPWPEMLTDPSLRWNALRWAQRIDPRSLKPATEVLALGTPIRPDGTSGPESPLILTMRYGAGRVVYVATDETWRYRYARGETLTERLWIPLVRLLARGSLGRGGQPAVIQASPEHAIVGQPVRVVVKLVDQSLIQRSPDSLSVRAARDGERATDRRGAESLSLAPVSDRLVTDVQVATFASTWVPVQPGEFVFSVDDPLLAGLELSTRVVVSLPEDELRQPQADHQALVTLAQATGGRVLTDEDLPRLHEVLPSREQRILGTPDVETLWDKPIIFAMLLGLLAAEWIGRRVIRLS